MIRKVVLLMKKNAFWEFVKHHNLGKEFDITKICGVLKYTKKWTEGVGDENDTAEIILHFEDGDVKVDGIRTNGDNATILLDSWEEI
ncbi:hypothetical protein [Bacillus cereus group sp. TH152-1LC]|uniref:hypothetical protein n=1 Tax=Bacillus cereus group sp. TH152-1LC TaxID=3018060 RepID=UPI0022E42FC0|nr:hypothetical protein [Bacillus cereus group sp. TH152-1LC]MDA1674682.1 hypothetical protein [Bacillus cereus group sp. TH152-1LC]